MRIKWIELNGFKSFPDRTRIELNEGITCFVGPNGAGKSNIVDAFRWILGEQNPRILRGEKMEEIIFQGSPSKKGKGLAEVSLYLRLIGDGTNGNESKNLETEIKRRFFKTGDSYFIINGKQARLKDIREIFLSEGVDVRTYSIIDQIKINDILSKSSHRKALLEECAGISLYKSKKTESEGKLQSAKENLQRIEDILGELKKQYTLLERQAKRAERYKKILDELANLELRFAKAESLYMLDELENLREELKILNIKIQELKQEISFISMKIDEQKSEILQLESIIDNNESQIKERENYITQVEKELALLSQDEKNKLESIERLRKENLVLINDIEKSKSELNSAKENADEIEKNISKIKGELIVFEENLLRISSHIEEIEKHIEKKRKSLFDLTTELVNKKNQYQSIKKAIENWKNQLRNLNSKKQEFREKLKLTEKEFEDRNKMLISIKESLQSENTKLNELLNRINILERDFEQKNQKLIDKKKEEAIINAKIEVLSSEIWEEIGKHKLFLESIEVSTEAEEIVEIYFDEKLKASVIEDIEQIEHSENKKFFFLKNTAVPVNNNPQKAGLKSIIEFIKIKENGINKEIFENIILVETLKEAIEKRQKFPLYCFVTKKGEVVFPDGFIRIGKAGDWLKKKRILEELQQEKEEIKRDIETLEKEIEQIKTEREKSKKDIEDKRKKIASLNTEIFRNEEKYKNLQKEIEGIRQKAKFMENEERALIEEIKANTKTIEFINIEIDDLSSKIDDEESEMETLKSQQKSLFKEHEREKEILSTKKIELSALQERLKAIKTEMNRLNEHIKKLLTIKIRNEEEIEKNLKKIENIKIEYSEKIYKKESLSKETHELREKLENLLINLKQEKEASAKLENKYHVINKELHNLTEITGKKQVKEGELKIKLENLWNEIYNFYGKDIFKEQIESTQDSEWTKGRINQLKMNLKEIGPVDMEILREYEEVKERYNFMLNQQRDIKTSIEELEEAIKKINSLTKKMLRETFDLLKERFNSVFQELFGGGKAEIVLNDENNILESELEIIVQPPGKKMNNINLLSGGEKTLTSIAFIFACLSIRPTPICIIDEVDAPLDESNTIRFRNLIKSFSDRIQFLIITHNKLMMEYSDYIYGVTMQEEGVSSIISLSLKEAEVYT